MWSLTGVGEILMRMKNLCQPGLSMEILAEAAAVHLGTVSVERLNSEKPDVCSADYKSGMEICSGFSQQTGVVRGFSCVL